MEISIDKDKCTLCGLCVRECVQGVLKDTGGEIIACRPEACYLCGHCVAVCPADAIENSGMDKTQIKRLGPLPKDAAKTYHDIIRLRRSVRNYKDKPVPREVIEDIIDLARYSPSAHNLQNVRYTIITDKNLLKAISAKMADISIKFLELAGKSWVRSLSAAFKNSAPVKRISSFIENSEFYKDQMKSGRDMFFYNAPVLILLHAKPGMLSEGNCFIAGTNIANYATSLGLGTCFIGLLTETVKYNRRLKAKLGIPNNEKLFAAIVCGWPEYTFKKGVSRRPVSVKWI